ncbi:unnamed protein product [Mytilus edulis]|uniref:Uncharacterized protein n=1 Tax=Mytilus edulis TaxID=6550 RepID=A0A8S3U207_MYTED|nr:unnamed protein product [Mytilus edulis]
MNFCQGCNDTVAGPDACISKLKSMAAALDMIRWCQHTRKAVSAIQKPSKLANESSSEIPGVVLGVSTITITVDHKEQPNSSAGRKVLALVDSGSEVTILKDTIFDTLEPNPYVIRRPPFGKREKTCVQSLTARKCPVKNCPVVVDRRDVKRHCLEEHHSEIFQTYHSKRLLNDSRFHQHRAYVVMLIAKWLTGQERVTSKHLVNFLNGKSLCPVLHMLQGYRCKSIVQFVKRWGGQIISDIV